MIFDMEKIGKKLESPQFNRWHIFVKLQAVITLKGTGNAKATSHKQNAVFKKEQRHNNGT
jgi:hypothetical protein